jgi:hypothetical protein
MEVLILVKLFTGAYYLCTWFVFIRNILQFHNELYLNWNTENKMEGNI